MSKSAVAAARVTTRESLEPMIARAKAENLFFYAPTQGRTITPEGLEAELTLGCYLWGPDNWVLRDAQGRGVSK